MIPMEKRQKDMFQSNQTNEGTETAMQPQEVPVPAKDVLSDQHALSQTAEASAEAIITTEIIEQQVTPTESTKEGAAANGTDVIDAATDRQSKTHAEAEATLQADIEEVDADMADFLSTENFVSGTAANTVRQADAPVAVINHRNSKRTKYHQYVMKQLGIKEGDLVNVTVKNKQVILLKSNDDKGIPMKKGGCLYSSALVNAITKEFAFNFTNQSTHHLLNVSYKKWNDQVIAIITK